MVDDFQPRGRKKLSTLDRWRLKRKTQDFVGPLSTLDRGHPKCIDFATCFGLSRSVIKQSNSNIFSYTCQPLVTRHVDNAGLILQRLRDGSPPNPKWQVTCRPSASRNAPKEMKNTKKNIDSAKKNGNSRHVNF